jgi:hypothetical protein
MGSQILFGVLGGHEGVSVPLCWIVLTKICRPLCVWLLAAKIPPQPKSAVSESDMEETNFLAGRQPILADEVQTFKALITVHKVLQEGHPSTLRDAMASRSWVDSLNRGMSGEGLRGYGPLIKEYVNFLLTKLTFHQQHPDFNGTFEYEEYISLKGINDPNEGYETISDLMMLQDRIEQFQKLIFSHFRSGGNNECRISALVPLVQESYGIYKFITSMLRAMHTSKFDFLDRTAFN